MLKVSGAASQATIALWCNGIAPWYAAGVAGQYVSVRQPFDYSGMLRECHDIFSMWLCASEKRFPILMAMNSPVIKRRGSTPEGLHERCLSAAIGTSAVLSIGRLKSRMATGERLALCASQSDDLAPSRPARRRSGLRQRLPIFRAYKRNQSGASELASRRTPPCRTPICESTPAACSR
jgi:hypothetical protein